MYLLLDYDNIPTRDKRHGLDMLVLRILDAIGADSLSVDERVTVRIYGGWFEGSNRTKRAQELVADIASRFPAPRTVSGTKGSKRVQISAALSDSIIAAPGKILTDTFRRSAADFGRFSVATAPFRACQSPASCSLLAAITTLKAEQCPTLKCPVEAHHVLSKPEQKLVDTMIVADLIELGRQKEQVAVISSDDDLWPGILSAIAMGGQVFHVRSRSGVPPLSYTSLLKGARYTFHTLPPV